MVIDGKSSARLSAQLANQFRASSPRFRTNLVFKRSIGSAHYLCGTGTLLAATLSDWGGSAVQGPPIATQVAKNSGDGQTASVGDANGTSATPNTFGPVTFITAWAYRFYCSVHAGPTDTSGRWVRLLCSSA